MRRASLVLAVLAVAAASGPAMSEELRGGYGMFAHFGAAYVKQADEAELFVLGTPVPGAGFQTIGALTLTVEAGAFLHEGWAVAVSGTVPTTTPNIAAGTLAGLGNLGDETVGFYSATGQHHFNMRGPISPYIGAGVSYMHVFGTADGVVTNLNINSAFGGVLQGGIDFQLNEQMGLFVDVKRFLIAATASGELGGNAITANATVNPWVLSTGVGIRF